MPKKETLIWIGHDLKSPFHVWDRLDCQGICLSAAQILSKPGYFNLFNEIGLHAGLQFDGPIFLDSGGFRLQQLGTEEYNVDDIISLYNNIEPEIAATLDVPLNPTESNSNNEKRWEQTLRNTERMSSRVNANTLLVPVIHAYDEKSTRRRLKQLLGVIKHTDFICIGSLVPLLKGSFIGSRFSGALKDSATIQRWDTIAEVITTMRELTPNSKHHVFGAGSISTMSLLIALGINSFDSTGWRLKAAFGAIQLPGLGDRFPRKSLKAVKERKGLTESCRNLLAQCECPICHNKQITNRINSLARSFRSRATHNAHVLTSEIRTLSRNVFNTKGYNQIDSRLIGSPRYHQVLRHLAARNLLLHQS